MRAGRVTQATVGLATGVGMLLCLGLAWASPTELRSGHIHWNAWEFTWELTETEGLQLREVTFDGKPILREASLPVIRARSIDERPWWHPYTWWPVSELAVAQRDGRCGPFQHRIGWTMVRPVPSCGDARLCIDSYFSEHVEWLELGVLAELGAQRVYQAWYLSEDGQITAGLQTRGRLCRADHARHAYWRFSFADREPGTHEVYVHEDATAETAWGPGWSRYTVETDALRDAGTHRSWFIRDRRRGSGVWIIPGPRDGAPDAFSNRDVSVRVRKDAEAGPWVFGAREDLGYDDGEALDRSGIDFWYIAHQQYRTLDGERPGTTLVGPTLRVQP